ncbi:MAG: putative signal transduction histidine kinase [Adhaeribacter sp.]|nr:putative signal transduction histidine kinase [Adhaeribacter sp.]
MSTTTRYNLIFSNERRYRLSRHVLFWSACVIFFTLIYGSRPGPTTENGTYTIVNNYLVSFAEAIFFLPAHMLLSYIIMYGLIPHFLFKEKYADFLLLLIASLLLEALASNILTVLVIVPFREYLGWPVPSSQFYYAMLAGLRGGSTVAGFAGFIKLSKCWYQKNERAQELEREKLKAELQLLKAQIHPHFLFNTLNNLYSLALTQSGQAPEVVLKLAGLLRYMLYECNVTQVPLVKEIKLIQDYIQLEELRYGDRLDLSVNITGCLEGKIIAPLMLLPFLENSFKHGASEELDQAWISLDLTIQGNKLKFKLINAVPPSPLFISPPEMAAHGIGLENVKKRLELIYPGRYELKTMLEDETYLVSLTLELDNLAGPTDNPAPIFKNLTQLETATEITA